MSDYENADHYNPTLYKRTPMMMVVNRVVMIRTMIHNLDVRKSQKRQFFPVKISAEGKLL